jgi:glutamyl-tRNA reductase
VSGERPLPPAAQAEIERARARLEKGADPVLVLEAFSHSLTNKLLHPAIEALKRSAT